MLRLNTGLIAGSMLFLSLAIPWTITWGVNTTWHISSFHFYILEFPFMAYYMIYIPGDYQSWWEAYNFAPRYLSLIFIIAGGVLAIVGGVNQHDELISWGGVLSVFAIIIFMGCKSAVITIRYPISQSYTILPLGLFVPAIYWILILLHPSTKSRHISPGRIYCGYCGREMSPEFNVCPFCGVKLTKPTCPNCGRTISLDYDYCPFCGIKLVGEAS